MKIDKWIKISIKQKDGDKENETVIDFKNYKWFAVAIFIALIAVIFVAGLLIKWKFFSV